MTIFAKRIVRHLQAHKHLTATGIATVLGTALDSMLLGLTSDSPPTPKEWGIGTTTSIVTSIIEANAAILMCNLKYWDTKASDTDTDNGERLHLLRADNCIVTCDFEQKYVDEDLWKVSARAAASVLPSVAFQLGSKALEAHEGIGSLDKYGYAFQAMVGLLIAGSAITAYYDEHLNGGHDHDHHDHEEDHSRHHHHTDVHHHLDTDVIQGIQRPERAFTLRSGDTLNSVEGGSELLRYQQSSLPPQSGDSMTGTWAESIISVLRGIAGDVGGEPRDDLEMGNLHHGQTALDLKPTIE
jgi:hypothetical protein